MIRAAIAAAAIAASMPTTPAEHVRTPDQTFLTFPEWYLVHSPAEYAGFLRRTENPSRFPLFSHIGQFWQSYGAVNREIAKYPFNAGYHLMVMVIGVSTTVEYALKGAYERSIGRIAEATKSGPSVPEEQFAARYAQAYVDFIRVEPWYKFDFWSQLKTLWCDVPLAGRDVARKWERRYALTTELLIKEGYARLIKLGSETVYDAPKPVTVVVLSRHPAVDGAHPDYQPLSATPSGPVLATIPRYEAFTAYGLWLARQGVDFVSIAGNDGEVLVSELVPNERKPSAVRVILEQPILTQPDRKRTVFAVPIGRLSAELRRAAAAGDAVEHIYDF